MTCDGCGQTIEIGDFPFCPHGKSTMRVVQDSIPGGMLMEHGLKVPRRVYSHSERRDVMRERGMTEMVRHVPEQGSDKSPHTSRWV